MRNFGLILLVAGVAGFLYCSAQLSGLDPLPADLALSDYLRNAAGRFELGRYVSLAAALIGFLLSVFPQGR
jgi:hypothetical protein